MSSNRFRQSILVSILTSLALANLAQPGARADEPIDPEAAAPPDAELPKEIKIGSSRLDFYGFVRLDMIYDDSRPSDNQTPTFILSETPGSENDDSFTLHPRLTRFGMNFHGPELDALANARLDGRLEIDFQNGGRESRAAPRFRHAFLTLGWERWTVLAGQTWEILSPLYPTVNSDTLMWNTGNLGDRRGQIRVSYSGNGREESEDARFVFQAGIGLTGAVNAQDLDGDGLLDGEDSGRPTLQARLGVEAERYAIGVSVHDADEEVTAPIAGQTTFSSRALALDFQAQLAPRLAVKGEAWTGEGLGDVRGGAGQSVNTTTGEVIDAKGGWIEVGVETSDRHSFFVGYTLDDPKDDEIIPGGRIENSAFYLVNRLSFGRPFTLGLDYLKWETQFQNLPSGDDNRLNFYAIYRF